MQVSKVIPDTSVMPGDTAVAIPNTGVRKMACSFLQGRTVGALVHFDGQINSRNFQRPQPTTGIVEIASYIRPSKACAAIGKGVIIRRYNSGAATTIDNGTITQHIAGGQIGGQWSAGIQGVGGGAAKGRRD